MSGSASGLYLLDASRTSPLVVTVRSITPWEYKIILVENHYSEPWIKPNVRSVNVPCPFRVLLLFSA